MVEEIVKTVLGELREMTRSETIVGKPMEFDEITIIPISKVSLGFVAGSGKKGKETDSSDKNRGSGTGGGATLEPLAFLVIKGGSAKLIRLNKKEPSLSQIIDLIPSLVKKFTKSKPGKKKSKSGDPDIEIVDEE